MTEYCGGYSVLSWLDTMSTVGGYHDFIIDVVIM